ncbi:MAG: response regulator transcription factor [Vallitaleaceae bacterium]|nr:response regulator transcription factor [Vallitaleaceae bacterium]
MKNVLIVEDDKRMNEIMTDYFEMSGFQVWNAYDGVEALRLFEKEEIDLVILDIMMPKLDGWSVCRRIRQKSNCLIIILSARSEDDDKLMGYELGADEYHTKPFSPKVLVASATALLRRSVNMEKKSDMIKFKELQLDKEKYSVTLRGVSLVLTVKEFELLMLLMEHRGKVFKREVLIETIWGYNYYGDGRVVDTNIKTLRKKLGDHAMYLQTVIGVGYKLEDK